MLCIDLSLKYVNFEGVQWVPLAESVWWNVLAKKNPTKGLFTALKGKYTNKQVKRIF